MKSIQDEAVRRTIAEAQAAAREQRTSKVRVDGRAVEIPRPYPSPTDWRDNWIYFLLLDRFNAARPPRRSWNQRCATRQGGTFAGVRAQLGYLAQLGVKTLWLSPIVGNAPQDENYHGYAAQNLLELDARFSADGTLATAEREFTALVDEAHARGMHVIVDIVLNHTARVFDYVTSTGATTAAFTDASVLDGPLGCEPAIRWLDAHGTPRADWQNRLSPPEQLASGDAVWPAELHDHRFFRRRGCKLGDTPGGSGFVRGDFHSLRQLVVEYDATVPGQETLRRRLGAEPVLNTLIRAYAYLMARYDLDGYRLDTVKYLPPKTIRTFGNAMREYAISLGKANFFTFGEIWDDEPASARFVGRDGGSGEDFGLDAALDVPLFYTLPAVAKGWLDVDALRAVFTRRAAQTEELLSSHGNASAYFVTFLDNHDQHERFLHPETPLEQLRLALTLLFTLPGIPALYYGTEQMLRGTVDNTGQPDLTRETSVREALWGKPGAFSTHSPLFREIRHLARLRASEPALRAGRLYFRAVSANDEDFGFSRGAGGIVAFSRILGDREIVVVANTGELNFTGHVLVDHDLNAGAPTLALAYSSFGTQATTAVQRIDANIFLDDRVDSGEVAALPVQLAAREAQVFTPLAMETAHPLARAATR